MGENCHSHFKEFIHNWAKSIINFNAIKHLLPGYFKFFIDWRKYSRLPGAESIRILNTCPRFLDQTEMTSFSPHLFFQAVWTSKKILRSGINRHVDIASDVYFVGSLSTTVKTVFVDIRPLPVFHMENFQPIKGNILSLPFKDNFITSLSCLHVAEHIGLGRYHHHLDPYGTKKACQELSRILAKGGNLYFSIPIGRPRLCFNSLRIYSPQQIIEYFDELSLIELSGIDDEGIYIENINPATLQDSEGACGLFHFIK